MWRGEVLRVSFAADSRSPACALLKSAIVLVARSDLHSFVVCMFSVGDESRLRRV